MTNDHHYYGGLWRAVEDVWPGATWSTVIHATAAENGSVEANVAADKLHNPNGLGHGRTKDEILLASASGGYVQLGRAAEGGSTIVLDGGIIDLESTIDNPSWYSDPYASEDAGDASGFVLGGLARAVDLPRTSRDPLGREGVLVWYVKPGKDGEGEWEKKLLWQDDGSNIRNVATAVLVGIDPQEEGGKKRAWLFVTGFSSENTVAVKVDL